MKVLTSLVAIAVVLSMILTVQAFTSQSEAVAWGLPPGFNPETGKIGMTTEAPGVCKASKLVGMTVKSAWGERFGSVEEVAFADNGAIKYLLVDRGDKAKSNERLVPVPWKTAEAGIRGDRLILGMSKDRFEKAPSFAMGDREKLADPAWNKKVHSYYESEEMKGARHDRTERAQMCARYER